MGLLEGLGYGIVRDFAGGLEEWSKQGGVLEPGQAKHRMLVRPLSWAGRLIAKLDGASARTLFRLGVLLVLASAHASNAPAFVRALGRAAQTLGRPLFVACPHEPARLFAEPVAVRGGTEC